MPALRGDAADGVLLPGAQHAYVHLCQQRDVHVVALQGLRSFIRVKAAFQIPRRNADSWADSWL